MSRDGSRFGGLWQGIGAIGLFVVIVAATLAAEFQAPGGFPAGAHITEGIGRALFNFGGEDWYGEGFLAAFIIVAVVLDVALDSSLLLARREGGED